MADSEQVRVDLGLLMPACSVGDGLLATAGRRANSSEFCLNRGIHSHDIRGAGHNGDRGEILDGIVGKGLCRNEFMQ
jgi:hypothetical protein